MSNIKRSAVKRATTKFGRLHSKTSIPRDKAFEKVFDQISRNCFDKQGNPLTLGDFCELIADPDYKILQQEHLHPKMFLSTVWLGTDHGWGERHKPVIFETMLFFDGEGGMECWRACSVKEALKNHRRYARQWYRKSKSQKRNFLIPLVKKRRKEDFLSARLRR
jgi:hypothetical protein